MTPEDKIRKLGRSISNVPAYRRKFANGLIRHFWGRGGLSELQWMSVDDLIEQAASKKE